MCFFFSNLPPDVSNFWMGEKSHPVEMLGSVAMQKKMAGTKLWDANEHYYIEVFIICKSPGHHDCIPGGTHPNNSDCFRIKVLSLQIASIAPAIEKFNHTNVVQTFPLTLIKKFDVQGVPIFKKKSNKFQPIHLQIHLPPGFSRGSAFQIPTDPRIHVAFCSPKDLSASVKDEKAPLSPTRRTKRQV